MLLPEVSYTNEQKEYFNLKPILIQVDIFSEI